MLLEENLASSIKICLFFLTKSLLNHRTINLMIKTIYENKAERVVKRMILVSFESDCKRTFGKPFTEHGLDGY